MTYPSRLRPSRAFTLIELLVAMVVATLVIIVSLSILNGLSQQWGANVGIVQGRAEARLALYSLRRDLEATVRAAPGTWLLLQPATMATGGGPASSEIYVLSTTQDRADTPAGDVWAVGYAPSLADPFQQGGLDLHGGLYRLSIKPTDVFASGIETQSVDKDWWWKDFWQPRRSGVDAPLNLLAAAAVFRCEAIVENRQTKVLQRVPSDRNVQAGAFGVRIKPALGTTNESDLRLAAIDITVVILRPQGAVLLRDRKTLTTEQWRRFGDTFTEHILF